MRSCIFFILLWLTTASKLRAQDQKPTPPWWVERFKVSAGMFFPINNTTVKVGSQNGDFGTTLDFEDNLGFRKNTFTFMGDFQWRASRRSRFDLSYYRLARNSNYVLDRTIEFGEHVYPVNVEVDAYFNTDIIRFSYGYAILTSPKYEAGLSFGAHIVRGGIGLAAIGSGAALNLSDDFGFTAPLGNFGIWGGYAITNRWAVNGEFDYLSLTIDNISGRILAGMLTVQYRVIPQLTVAAGYTGLNFKVNVEKERLKGELLWGYNGPSVSANFMFGKKRW